MSFDAETALVYNVANAPIRIFPYPHIYVPNVFPAEFYAEIQRHMPDPDAMIPIEQVRPVKGYPERFVLAIASPQVESLPDDKKLFWKNFASWLIAGRFGDMLLGKFGAFIQQRFEGVDGIQFYNESLLVRDITKYALGPHTDSPRKVLTLLFYLPKDESQSHLGTSIYLPKDSKFSCAGGPHYGFEPFHCIATMPFRPNSLFAFVKTNNSFHGVEPILDQATNRWLLLYDIFVRQSQPSQVRAEAAQQQPVSNISFKF